MKRARMKPHYVLVTNPEEQAAVKRGGLWDPVGEFVGGIVVAWPDTLREYRARKGTANNGPESRNG